MPELPEVETVARSLRPLLVGRTLGALWTSGLRLRRPVDAAGLRLAAEGARVEAVERRGKYLLIHLAHRGSSSAARSSPKPAQVIVCHLGMTGRLLVEPAQRARVSHTHVVFALGTAASGAAGGDELRYVDPRRFGHFNACPADDLEGAAELGGLGVDPLAEAFTPSVLAAALALSRRAIKDFLLDQRHVAGLGNIYAAEALYQSAISPRRRADRLGTARAAALHGAIVSVLSSAVLRRGTSFSDYVDASGQSGDNQNHLGVYGREGEPCQRCGSAIRRLVQGARSTFYCPRCQR